jgi:hypothetical protein
MTLADEQQVPQYLEQDPGSQAGFEAGSGR